jgi:hypothetical protein
VRLRLFLLVASALLAACTATETGNPAVPMQLALTAVSSTETVALAGAARQGTLRVDEVWVVLGDLRFVQSDRCDEGPARQADIEGPLTLELLSSTQPLEFELEVTAYCRVRIPLERSDEPGRGVPAELEDHALLVRGVRVDGTPFAVRSRRTREADLRSRGEPFSVERGREALLLAFDVGRWLDGVDVEGAAVDDDGVVWIDDDRERDRLERFEENVEAAMELFRDLNEDGRLDDDEPSLARGGP